MSSLDLRVKLGESDKVKNDDFREMQKCDERLDSLERL
jgi:hypothetical protein